MNVNLCHYFFKKIPKFVSSYRYGIVPFIILISSNSLNSVNAKSKSNNNGINGGGKLPTINNKKNTLTESAYFPSKSHYGQEPNANVTYTLNHSFSSIINGYKMAEVYFMKINI